jgi:hypothetical protein
LADTAYDLLVAGARLLPLGFPLRDVADLLIDGGETPTRRSGLARRLLRRARRCSKRTDDLEILMAFAAELTDGSAKRSIAVSCERISRFEQVSPPAQR